MKGGILLVGLGPAGLAFLLRILSHRPGLAGQILAVDKGSSLDDRLGRARSTMDRGELTSGFGGAGLFSDGKFCLSLEVGGRLAMYLTSSERKLLEDDVDGMFTRFDGKSHITFPEKPTHLIRRLKSADLSFTQYPVRHYGTDQLVDLNRRLLLGLQSLGVRFLFDTALSDLARTRGAWQGTLVSQNGEQSEEFETVVLAVGKRGARWLHDKGRAIGLDFETQPVRFGVRVETPRNGVRALLKLGADPKLHRTSDEAKTKVHCFCDGGELLSLDYDGIRVLGGHSLEGKKTAWSNFGVLTEVRPRATWDTTATAMEILRPFTSLSPSEIVGESLTSFLTPSRDAVLPVVGTVDRSSLRVGHINPLLGDAVYRRVSDFLRRMLMVCPDISPEKTAIYAPAIEWWYDRVTVDPKSMKTALAGLYAIGDGAGWSQGIVHAAATGVRAADALAAACPNT